MITPDQQCSKPGLYEHWFKKYKARQALQTKMIVERAGSPVGKIPQSKQASVVAQRAIKALQ